MGWSRVGGDPVKRGLARHLEGWQVGALAVFLAGAMAVLVVPRPVEHMELPEPRVDQRTILATMRADDRLAELAAKDGLDVDVRRLGSDFRAYGKGDAEGSNDALEARDRIVQDVPAATTHGEEVLRLRAFQLREFVRAVRAWESTGKETKDLVELGGSFLRAMRRNERLAGRRVTMDEPALRASFKRRWNEIVGIEGGVFALTLDEQRAFYRYLLRHPATPPDDGAPRLMAQSYADNFRLKKIDELARIDPTYPADFGRGVLHFRLGKFGLSMKELQRHLDASQDGPLALRAQNYLSAALARERLEQM